MKKNRNQSEGLLKRILRSQATSVISFSLAAVLLLFGGIGGARAAFIDQSDIYRSQVGMDDIGVSLLENDIIVAARDYKNAEGERNGQWSVVKKDLLSGLPDNIIPGVSYKEELKVKNTRTINEYVRVTIYKYWLDPDGEKTADLSPDLIQLNLINLNDENWHRDVAAQTKERTVLYYQKLLPSGGETSLFADKVSVDGSIATMLKRSEKTTDTGKTITHTYKYQGYQICLEVTVDAIQENNASMATGSVWGNVDSGTPWPATD